MRRRQNELSLSGMKLNCCRSFGGTGPIDLKCLAPSVTIPNLHHVEISYGFLPKCLFPKKIASYVLMGKNDALGWQGPPFAPGERLGISAIKTGQDVHHECGALESYRDVIVLFFGPIVLQCSVHVWVHFQSLPTKLIFRYFDGAHI